MICINCNSHGNNLELLKLFIRKPVNKQNKIAHSNKIELLDRNKKKNIGNDNLSCLPTAKQLALID